MGTLAQVGAALTDLSTVLARLRDLDLVEGPDDDLDTALDLITQAWANVATATDILRPYLTPLPPATDVASLAAQQDAALDRRGYL